MLSDGHMQWGSLFSNDRLIVNQSGKIEKRLYFELVYNLFKFCCTKNFDYYIKTWRDKKK